MTFDLIQIWHAACHSHQCIVCLYRCHGNMTYSVHEWPQGESAVHAASRDDDVCSQIKAAADGRGPAREGGAYLHTSEGDWLTAAILTPGKRSYCGASQVNRRPPVPPSHCSSDKNMRPSARRPEQQSCDTVTTGTLREASGHRRSPRQP